MVVLGIPPRWCAMLACVSRRARFINSSLSATSVRSHASEGQAAATGRLKVSKSSVSTGSTTNTTVPLLRSALLPVVYHDAYSAPQLTPGHRFPMAIFERIHDRLLNHHRLIRPEQVRGR